MYRSKILTIIFSFTFLPNIVFGSPNHPTRGIVYNTKESSMIEYDCKLQKNQELKCDITQTSIRKTNKKLSEEIKEAKKQWENQKPFNKKECKIFEEYLPIVEGKMPAPNKNSEDKIKNMKSFQKNDFIKLGKSILKYCQKPDLNNFLKIITIEHDKKTRTCKVSSNSFKQKFEKADLKSNTWRVIPEAKGTCGIIQLDRFELDNKKFSFWNYISKKAITNPKGKGLLLNCNKLDETEYIFSWKKREIALNCDYIDFSY